jgi:hypothetical protein
VRSGHANPPSVSAPAAAGQATLAQDPLPDESWTDLMPPTAYLAPKRGNADAPA